MDRYEYWSDLPLDDWDVARAAVRFLNDICRASLPNNADPLLSRSADEFDKAARTLSRCSDGKDEGCSVAYWLVDGARKRLQPRANPQLWAYRQWLISDCAPCDGRGCVRCSGSGYKDELRAPELHVAQAYALAAELVQLITSGNRINLHVRFTNVVIETRQAGLPRDELLLLTWTWRFFAAGHRMPISEELRLAFQAAWEIGHHDFACSIARRGYGEVTAEQAARLPK